MKYKFIDQILDICKANAVVTLEKMIIPMFYQHILKKYSILVTIKQPHRLKL